MPGHACKRIIVFRILEAWILKQHIDANGLRLKVSQGFDHQRIEVSPDRLPERLDRLIVDVDNDDVRVCALLTTNR